MVHHALLVGRCRGFTLVAGHADGAGPKRASDPEEIARAETRDGGLAALWLRLARVRLFAPWRQVSEPAAAEA